MRAQIGSGLCAMHGPYVTSALTAAAGPSAAAGAAAAVAGPTAAANLARGPAPAVIARPAAAHGRGSGQASAADRMGAAGPGGRAHLPIDVADARPRRYERGLRRPWRLRRCPQRRHARPRAGRVTRRRLGSGCEGCASASRAAAAISAVGAAACVGGALSPFLDPLLSTGSVTYPPSLCPPARAARRARAGANTRGQGRAPGQTTPYLRVGCMSRPRPIFDTRDRLVTGGFIPYGPVAARAVLHALRRGPVAAADHLQLCDGCALTHNRYVRS